MTLSAAVSGPAVAAVVLTATVQACRDEDRLRFCYTTRGFALTECEVRERGARFMRAGNTARD
ncbi:hypothetical protein [Embleya scabrispora]|nr:hypothetical protein [Embleya scabrispora]